MRGVVASSFLCIAVSAFSAAAGAQCGYQWRSGFGPQGGGGIATALTFDDGSGPALFVAGGFAEIVGVPARNIARWDGHQWSQVGAGVGADEFERITEIAIYDDGAGPALYAMGNFTEADGASARSLARWDGQSWEPVGDGFVTFTGYYGAMTAFDDGSGPALYIGGDFDTTGSGLVVNNIMRWDGATLSPVGSGANNWIDALAVFDDGSGPALYAAGGFSTAGGVPCESIARWNGQQWSPVGAGMPASGDRVNALAVFDDGAGPALYAGGRFTTAGAASVSNLARWDGGAWSDVGGGVTGTTMSFPLVNTLRVVQENGAPSLWIGGHFDTAGGIDAPSLARWDGVSLTPVGGGASWAVESITPYTAGSDSGVLVSGGFRAVGTIAANHMARWRDGEWSIHGEQGLGTPEHWPDPPLTLALQQFDDGAGPAMFVGGDFGYAGDAPALSIAKRTHAGWSAFGEPFERSIGPGWVLYPFVSAMTVFDDGSGPALYATGQFLRAGNVTLNHVGRWDGVSWSALGTGLNPGAPSFPHPNAMAAFDDGFGAALYVGGQDFALPGAGFSNYRALARWRNGVWAPIDFYGVVNALAVFDDDAAGPLPPALYIGCVPNSNFPDRALARWDGVSMTYIPGLSTGSSTAAEVNALCLFDDGAGPALYVGGAFTSAGGLGALRIARWNGESWSALTGAGTSGRVRAMTVMDDGNGPALFLSGSFSTAGGHAAIGVARYRASGFAPLGSGVQGGTFSGMAYGPSVRALAPFDSGAAPPILCVGGVLGGAGGTPSHGFALWAPPDACCPGDANNDRVVNFADLNAVLSAFGASGTASDADMNGDGFVNFADLNLVLGHFGDAC